MKTGVINFTDALVPANAVPVSRKQAGASLWHDYSTDTYRLLLPDRLEKDHADQLLENNWQYEPGKKYWYNSYSYSNKLFALGLLGSINENIDEIDASLEQFAKYVALLMNTWR